MANKTLREVLGGYAFLPATAIFDAHLTDAEFRLLAVIDWFEGKNGGKALKQSTIADRLHVKRQQVNHSIRNAIKLGHLIKDQPNRRRASIYKLPLREVLLQVEPDIPQGESQVEPDISDESETRHPIPEVVSFPEVVSSSSKEDSETVVSPSRRTTEGLEKQKKTSKKEYEGMKLKDIPEPEDWQLVEYHRRRYRQLLKSEAATDWGKDRKLAKIRLKVGFEECCKVIDYCLQSSDGWVGKRGFQQIMGQGVFEQARDIIRQQEEAFGE